MTSPTQDEDQQGTNITDSDVTFWLVLSIISAFICFQPVGIVAAIFGILAYIDFQSGKYKQAEMKLGYAKMFTYIAAGIVVFLILLFLFCVLPFGLFV
ncbi:MAG: CD225/dispanin family protein [Candidatus Sumerlaeia bacterium]|nr:CD225/dispanin family protein [Candidatus Sumerlaeia bacterium]